MAKYRFEQLNNGAEIDNPKITINPIVRNVNPIAMTIDVSVLLSIDGAAFGVELTDVTVKNLNYDAESLQARVMEKLATFEV